MADTPTAAAGHAGAGEEKRGQDASAKALSAGALAAELIEAAPDAILTVGPEGRVRSVNRQAEVLFGYPRGELAGAPIEALLPDRLAVKHVEHRDAYFHAPRARAMGGGYDFLGKRKDGSEFPVDVSLTSIDTPEGRVAAAFVRDITERTRAEERLRQANRDLESFSHTISHDLRTPLRSMRGFSRALLEDYGPALDPTARDYLARIDRAGASMERLIDDLLEYSRIGRKEVATRAVRLDEVVGEVVRALGPEVERMRASLEVARPLPSVTAEPQLLAQALTNLLTNALKYVPQGRTPVVRVSALAREGRVRITVEDEGLGIAAEHFERIWLPFERLHGRDAYPGTGVGLAIVQRAVERMGGRVGVESQPGSGSRFWIELPAAKGGPP